MPFADSIHSRIKDTINNSCSYRNWFDFSTRFDIFQLNSVKLCISRNTQSDQQEYIRLVAIIFTVRTSNTGIAILEYYPTYVSATEKH